MKNMKITLFALLVLSVLAAGCSVQYKEFKDGSFSANYPDWNTVAGSDKVNVQKGACKVDIGIQAAKFNPDNLKVTIDVSIIPALKRLMLTIDDYKIEGNEAILKLTGTNVYGEQKYIACDGRLYKVSAGCDKKNNVIDTVISSAKCIA